MGKKPLHVLENELRARLDPEQINASSNITPAELVTLGKKAGIHLSDQDSYTILSHHSRCTIANRFTLDRPSFQPTFSWQAFQKGFWGPSQAEAMVQDWVPNPYTPQKQRTLSDAHDSLKKVLSKHAKQGSNGLRKLLRLLLGANSEHYGIGLSALVFRREMTAMGSDLDEGESTMLFEHNCDPLTKMLNFDRFAAAFMPPGWADSQLALADSRKNMREEVESKFAKAERPKREHPTSKAAPWKTLEKNMHEKINLRTLAKPKRQGLGACYRLFSQEQNDPVTLETFIRTLTRLHVVFAPETAKELFNRYDKDGDGVISFVEFQRNVMPKDITAEAQNNTLFGDHAPRYEAPRKPRGANLMRRIAMQQQGMTLPDVKQDLSGVTLHSLPIRKSPFSLVAPENPFKFEDKFSNGPSYKEGTTGGPLSGNADVGRKDLLGRDPRRRKMDMPCPPTPHFFKSFHM